MKLSDLIMCIGFGIMFLVYVIQMCLTKRFLDELKTRFTDKWTELGKPSLFLNNSIGNNISWLSYLWQKKYLSLNDPAFSNRCSTARRFSIFSLCVGVIWVAGGLCVILLTKK